ncbi:MAG: Lrp/AsnC ligand binding domain-containing protein [Pseudomonadota bacterium]
MRNTTKILSRHDRAILKALHEDGRMPVTALAERIGLSPNATNERLRRLIRDGVIEGFHARISPRALGRTLIAFVEVKLERTSADVFDAFAAAAAAEADIEECHMVAGGFDYLLKTRHADMAAYRRFLADALLTLPGVRETHTFVVMEEVKSGHPLPS